jgi:NAD(P)-dependent dehydrogenase (short-subunit alcohol dehydrogenase family)
MNNRLLITGSNRGTGRAIAQVFADRGYNIASLNRTCTGESWLGEITCDIAQDQQIRSGFQEAISRLHGVDVCIMNAAVRRFNPIMSMSDADWEESVATNLTAVFRLARLAIPYLIEAQGTFVILGSHAGRYYFESGSAYCATKAALKAFAEVLSLETKHLNIRTILVVPGAIRNRDKEYDEQKIQPLTVGNIIYNAVTCAHDATIAEIEIRPSNPRESPVQGIERLQFL